MKQRTIILGTIAIVIVAIGAIFLSGYKLPNYTEPIPTTITITTTLVTTTISTTTTTSISPQEQPTQPQTVNVEIKNFAFSPATITIKVGDSVRWNNGDSVSHTATADDGSFDTGLMGQGQSKTLTFDKAGTYNYHCTPHPWMKAKVVVE